MELIKVENNNIILDEEISNKIAEYEKTIKTLKEQQDELKQKILDEMESKNIIKIDNSKVTINYIASTDREDFDKKSLRQDHPQLYDAYIKMTPVKASLRIKVKDE